MAGRFSNKLNFESDMGVSENRGKTPKSSILIRFSIIFTIHFGVPLFLETSTWKQAVNDKETFAELLN